MSDRPSLRDLVEVQARFRLPSPALVEKDWFVIQALRAIVAADKGPFQLVFQGGTALSRAWGLINRMFEDIDIKIVSEGRCPSDVGSEGLTWVRVWTKLVTPR